MRRPTYLTRAGRLAVTLALLAFAAFLIFVVRYP